MLTRMEELDPRKLEDASSTKPPRLLKSGYPAHNFTDEERRRGGATTAARKREQVESQRARYERIYSSHEPAIIEALAKAAAKGDVSAFTALHDRIYGTPNKAEPERIELDIGTSAPRGVSLADIAGGVSQAGENTAYNEQSPPKALEQAKDEG